MKLYLYKRGIKKVKLRKWFLLLSRQNKALVVKPLIISSIFCTLCSLNKYFRAFLYNFEVLKYRLSFNLAKNLQYYSLASYIFFPKVRQKRNKSLSKRYHKYRRRVKRKNILKSKPYKLTIHSERSKLSRTALIKTKLKKQFKQSFMRTFFFSEVNNSFNFIYNYRKRYLNFFINKVTSSVKKKAICYFSSFLCSFLENILKKKVFVKISNLRAKGAFKNCQKFINHYTRKLRKFVFRVGRGFYIRDSIEMLITLAKSKDLSIFLTWLRRTAERFDRRAQKKFFYYIRAFVRKTFKTLFNCFGSIGFYITIKGKVGVSGNAKRRKFFIKKGRFSSSTKKLKVSYAKELINTKTGVLGVTCLLAFI